MLEEMVPLATAECREPASSDRLPVHRSESPTGYSSAGCSPAEPASASPVTDNSSLIPILRLALMQCCAGRLCRQRGCHLYFAHRVTFVSCADTCCCKRNIEMTPLCKVEVTLARVLGSREVRLGGGVDEQAGVQPS
jgi:hypothetical protein